VNREVEIETLPDEIPENFTIDVAALKLNESVRAKDIPMTGSMRLMSDPELVISHVVSLREEAAAEAGPAEPEVAKKGKKEEPAAKAAKSAPAKSAPAKAAAPAKKK